jgi:2-polyprenyl-6-methoxyphenol hydroxylase-like FAD-dependent oxidoreductase
VALMGDAAHAMYPTGSNGASQAIIDGRTIGAMMLDHGVGPEALSAYDAALCGPVSELVLRNRNAGPFGLLDIVDDALRRGLRRHRRCDPGRRTRGLHRRLQGRRRLRHRPAERGAADDPARARR